MHDEFQELAALDALGISSEDESETLLRHVESCPECQTESIEDANAAAALALALEPVRPPDEVKTALMRSLVRDADEKEEEERSRRLIPAWWLATAATFFMALFGWSELRLRAAREQIAEIQATQRNLTEENQRLSSKYETLSTHMKSMASVEMISMKGMPPAPAATGRMFMDPVAHKGLVVLANLPMTTDNRCYQLWIMSKGSAAPISAGTFEVHDRSAMQMELRDLPAEMAGLAVTAEPRGGMPAPTGEKYLAGSIS